MKRIIACILSWILLLGIVGCAKESPSAQTPTETEEILLPVVGAGFRVGFGRSSITPQENLPLGGYGTSSTRITEDVLDEIYVDCIALTDENNETMLLMLTDLQRIEDSLIDMLRLSVYEATGIAQERIIISCSHTHSRGKACSYTQCCSQSRCGSRTDLPQDL